MEHDRPKWPGDTTGAGRVWTDQGLARNGGGQPTCVLVAGLVYRIVLRIVSYRRWKFYRAIQQKTDNATCERFLA